MGIALLAIFAATGCKSVKGSCDQRSNGTFECEEILASSIAEDAKKTCVSGANSQDRGKWADKTKCDRTGAIGGCETNLNRTWYYPGGRLTKIEHVAQMCSGANSKLLDANGKEKKGVTAEKIPAGGPTADPALEAMISPNRAMLEANIGAIEKLRPAGAVPGKIMLSGGRHVPSLPTTAAIWEDDIAALSSRTIAWRKEVPFKDGSDLRSCATALRLKERSGKTDADVQRILKWCAGLNLLMVVKATKLEAPADVPGFNFHGGVAEGTVYAYELPSGKPAGGFAFRAGSSDKVKSNELDEDFAKNIGKALTAGVAKADPGATYEFTVMPTRK